MLYTDWKYRKIFDLIDFIMDERLFTVKDLRVILNKELLSD